MYISTKAIVLHALTCSDKTCIVHLFTAERGRISCIVYGAKRASGGMKAAFLQPLTLVDLELELLPGRDLHRIKEAKLTSAVASLMDNPVKSAIALFLAEFLYRTLRDEQVDRKMFDFLEHSIVALSQAEKGIANFHLVMLLQMTQFFGFYPNWQEQPGNTYFDLTNGIFLVQQPPHAYYLKPEEGIAFRKLMRMTYNNMQLFSFSRKERIVILEHVLSYYRIHLHPFGEIKSLPVLTELFD